MFYETITFKAILSTIGRARAMPLKVMLLDIFQAPLGIGRNFEFNMLIVALPLKPYQYVTVIMVMVLELECH